MEICPREVELFFGFQNPNVQDHIRHCTDCAELTALVRRVTAERDGISEITEEEVRRVASFVVRLIQGLSD